MLNAQEKHLIKKYYLFTILSKVSFIMALLIGIPWIICCMINDIAYEGVSFSMVGMYVYLALVLLYMIAFCYMLISVRRGVKKEAWQKIVEKAQVTLSNKDYSDQLTMAVGAGAAGRLLRNADSTHMQNAGKAFEVLAAAGSAITVHQMTKEMAQNVRLVAGIFSVELPKASKYVLSVILIPIMILVGSYIPQFVSSSRILEEHVAVSSESVHALESVMDAECGFVFADDPKERYNSSGYRVTGYLKEFDTPNNASVSVLVGNDGVIEKVSYSIDVDIHGDKEENLQRAQQSIQQLNSLVKKSGVAVQEEELLQVTELPEEFVAQFRETSYYEKVRVSVGENSSCSYYTSPEDQYDEYSSSYIYLNLAP